MKKFKNLVFAMSLLITSAFLASFTMDDLPPDPTLGPPEYCNDIGKTYNAVWRQTVYNDCTSTCQSGGNKYCYMYADTRKP